MQDKWHISSSKLISIKRWTWLANWRALIAYPWRFFGRFSRFSLPFSGASVPPRAKMQFCLCSIFGVFPPLRVFRLLFLRRIPQLVHPLASRSVFRISAESKAIKMQACKTKWVFSFKKYITITSMMLAGEHSTYFSWFMIGQLKGGERSNSFFSCPLHRHNSPFLFTSKIPMQYFFPAFTDTNTYKATEC